MKKIKNIAILFICMVSVTVIQFSVNASFSEPNTTIAISPRYTYIATTTTSHGKSSSGGASCTTTISAYSSSQTSRLLCTLKNKLMEYGHKMAHGMRLKQVVA